MIVDAIEAFPKLVALSELEKVSRWKRAACCQLIPGRRAIGARDTYKSRVANAAIDSRRWKASIRQPNSHSLT